MRREPDTAFNYFIFVFTMNLHHSQVGQDEEWRTLHSEELHNTIKLTLTLLETS